MIMDTRNKVVDMHQPGKGYKAISKALGLQRTTVRAIIHKWRKLGTVVNLPRSDRPTKITPGVQRRLIQEVIKEPRTTAKELQASLASVNDDESENLVSVQEPQSPSTTNADLLSLITSLAHRAMLLSDIKVEDEDQECSPEQKPVHSPDQHSAGPSVPQQHSTGLLPSPDSKSHCVTGSPSCTSTAISPGRPETICAPSFSFSPAPPPAAHSSQFSIDSVSFWKSCNKAGCTQAIFANFINEMNKISSRIQSDQASQEDYDLALKVMLDSGKLAELVVKQ
ncbi:uncharacterized protein LOC113172908 isoform X2 [Anabas testudineus]|uniref:uncharacterized protein LOC113172908 isoform X2 n=1 Tax=Anabas testudineus TaxID=64144 RepID=UPI000E454940|nr:uncharacterized protein LOC113172908 isoform X2 [Anabas testudineus]